MKKKSIAKNAILNVIKTLGSIIFPLITFPYISRILHTENMGIYNFNLSIINYFVLIAALGISTYSIREGAAYRENRSDMSNFASEIFTINMISTAISYILLIIGILIFPVLRINASMLLILSISIIFTTIGCDWIFSIYEEFKYITIRSIFFQILSIILMFIFVKNQNDLFNYAIITIIASSGANIINFVSLKKYCDIKLIFSKKILKHIYPILILFANSIAMTLYINSDMTILGILSNNYYTGLYSVSTKVYTTLKTILGALIIVSIPRLSYYLGNNMKEEYQKSGNKIFNLLLIIVVPAMTWAIFMSKNIILILSGSEYIEATTSLQILEIALIFSIISWFYSSCILIPNKKEKKVLIATLTSAILNVIFNIILIPKYNQNAAAFTTVIAEFTSGLITYIYGRKYFKNQIKVKDIISCVIGCIIVLISCYFSNYLINNPIFSCIVSGVLSCIIYIIYNIIFNKEKIIELKKIIKSK